MVKKDYYSVLGVRHDASDKEIKQTYRRLARQYHPDVNPGDVSAEQKFKEISEAYTVLSNPDGRKKYDRFGHQAFASGFDPAFARETGFDRGQHGNFRDFFSGRGPFDGLNSLFEELWGVEDANTHSRERRQDKTSSIRLSSVLNKRCVVPPRRCRSCGAMEGQNDCKSKSLPGSIRVRKYG